MNTILTYVSVIIAAATLIASIVIPSYPIFQKRKSQKCAAVIKYSPEKGSLYLENTSNKPLFDLRLVFPKQCSNPINMKALPIEKELSPRDYRVYKIFEDGYKLDHSVKMAIKYREHKKNKEVEIPTILNNSPLNDTKDLPLNNIRFHVSIEDMQIKTYVNTGVDPRISKSHSVLKRLDILDQRYENVDKSERWWAIESNPREYKEPEKEELHETVQK